MGQIQAKRGRNAIALDYFRQAIPISRENSNAFAEADARLNLARIFQQLGAVDSTLIYARSSTWANVVGTSGESYAAVSCWLSLFGAVTTPRRYVTSR